MTADGCIHIAVLLAYENVAEGSSSSVVERHVSKAKANTRYCFSCTDCDNEVVSFFLSLMFDTTGSVLQL